MLTRFKIFDSAYASMVPIGSYGASHLKEPYAVAQHRSLAFSVGTSLRLEDGLKRVL